MAQVQDFLQLHPQWPAVAAIYHRLQAHGYKAFLAGGCVRDALLGRKAHDLDIATDASPEQIEKIFEKTVGVGKSFGVIRVLVDGSDIEVATFRSDGLYQDGRRPENVQFTSPREDAQRRDFTINALFFDLEKNQLLDFVQGQADLAAKRIRTVGAPEQRFAEDHLRLLRAVRFVAQLDFVIEEKTFAQIQALASTVKMVSGERLRDEMVKLLRGSVVQKGLKEFSRSGLMSELFPFRVQDDSWEGFSFQEDWQGLSLFLQKASLTALKEIFIQLRLSTKEKKNIEDCWNLWQQPELFFTKSLGEKIQALARPGILWALQVLVKRHDTFAAPSLELCQKWQSLQMQLPSPFLRGEDAQSSFAGAALGEVLQRAFILQLEDHFKDRAEALAWLGQQKNKG